VTYDYDYAALDNHGKVYTWGTNNQDHLGFGRGDASFKNETANLVRDLTPFVAFDVGLNEKNLVAICFTRDIKSEQLFHSTPMVKEYYDCVRYHLDTEMTDLKFLKYQDKPYGPTDLSMQDAKTLSVTSPKHDQ
jgi:hypothetical protein